MLRSGMMGWLTIMMDTNTWSTEQHAEAKREIGLYKNELRPLIRDADLYHISPRPDGVLWDAIEYWDNDRQCGVIYAFRGTVAGESEHSFALKGLNPSTQYAITFHDHTSADRRNSGLALMEHGLKVNLAFENRSELIFVRKETR